MRAKAASLGMKLSDQGLTKGTKKLSVKSEKDLFKKLGMKYIIPTEKKPVIKDLKKYVSESDKIWLASDEDREGEAIAWHLYENLDLTNKDYDRIVDPRKMIYPA